MIGQRKPRPLATICPEAFRNVSNIKKGSLALLAMSGYDLKSFVPGP